MIPAESLGEVEQGERKKGREAEKRNKGEAANSLEDLGIKNL